MPPTRRSTTRPPAPADPSNADRIAALAVLVFAALISMFAVRNNDIWWLLAVARRIVETRSFITTDPFTFTVTGTPWAPQAYLGALLFYAVHSFASAWGLVVLRAALVTAIFATTFATVRRVGVGWLAASPLLLVALLNAHSRFLVRAHLFEYLFVAVLMWFLLTAGRRRGRSFFVIPVVLQLLWVNMHPSFALGPVLVVLFFAAEWIAKRLSGRSGFVRAVGDGYDWRRVGLLILFMAAACLVNPSPSLFLTQPFGGEQRELISRFTLEWRSPFDPALSRGAFHPYYEILLGAAALSIVLGLGRFPLAPAVLIVATAVLSLQAHRFRVEFALVGVPMICVLLRSSPAVSRLVRRGRVAARARWAAAAASAILVATAADRVDIGEPVADRFPGAAFEWIGSNDVARRPFHTIGHGSYLLWALYGERSSFIDGRNFSPGLYRDFLAAQMNERGRASVAAKYDLDAYVLPPIEQSDAGIERIHRSLVGVAGWTLCYLDRHAWVYVRDATVDPQWLAANGFAAYHPLTLHNRRISGEEMRAVTRDLERAVAASPDYVRTRIDLALVYSAAGDRAAARREIERALEIDPGHETALELRERLRGRAR